MTALDIWFWQRIVTPHMAGLAVALASRGCRVTYVAERPMSESRAQQGWSAPEMPGVEFALVESKGDVGDLLDTGHPEAMHVCQGIRANGRVGYIQSSLAQRGLHQWVAMETVDDVGCTGMLRRLEYARRFSSHRATIEGVLAIGYKTADWVVARGMPAELVFPFAYFLPKTPAPDPIDAIDERPFRFVFAGQLIKRKRVDLLLEALAGINNRAYELVIIGTGPEEAVLRARADRLPVVRRSVRWRGQLPMTSALQEMAQADCLVLPSRHDGWGAVVSEALLAGTPAVCSDACGGAGVVRASGAGGVFQSESVVALEALLREVLTRGRATPSERHGLAAWAESLGAQSGAEYLEEILTHRMTGSPRPGVPWERV